MRQTLRYPIEHVIVDCALPPWQCSSMHISLSRGLSRCWQHQEMCDLASLSRSSLRDCHIHVTHYKDHPLLLTLEIVPKVPICFS